jgi:transcription-repair coupling factor (superfamily II helicase)
VLTLTATPIPRTLQLSLSGVRDLSIIGTPPVDRLRSAPMSANSTRSPCARRFCANITAAGSFFVVPRIADLPEIEAFLRDEVPEVSVSSWPMARWRRANSTTA